VHINSAVAGLVAAIMAGKRSFCGRKNMAPGDRGMTMTGAALTSGGLAGMAMINTHLATSAAVVSWTLVEWIVKGKPSLLGAVSGLVAITPACGFVGVSGALVIGLAAGVVCYWGVTGFKGMFKYDGALDVWGMHGLGGILGAMLTGAFALNEVGSHKGLIEGNPGQLHHPQADRPHHGPARQQG
jgi:ammonium transporter, Amt family